MKKSFFLITTLFIVLSASAQQAERVTYSIDELPFFEQFATGRNNILITQDKKLSEVTAAYVEYLKTQPVKGWRVQIYFGTGQHAREEAEKIRAEFLAKDYDVPVYITYDPPYFKVAVGNFADKIYAAKYLYLLKQEYPKAFLTETEIDINKLTQ